MSLIDLSALPSLPKEFARAVLTGPFRAGARSTLPETVLRVSSAPVERQRVLAYQHLTGFTPGDVLPVTYPHVLSFPLQAKLMAAPGFPLPLPGLVHLANEITQYATLTVGDRIDVTVHAEGLRPHPRGTAVDVLTSCHRDHTLVWSARSTYLQRGPQDPAAAVFPPPPPVPPVLPSARWRVPADLGRRYATVSGDVNPIHLSRLTARLFGFPRAIAPGMWSLARVLAAYGQRTHQPHTSRVWFRSPILLPAMVFVVREPGGPVTAMVSGERVHLVVEVAAPGSGSSG